MCVCVARVCVDQTLGRRPSRKRSCNRSSRKAITTMAATCCGTGPGYATPQVRGCASQPCKLMGPPRARPLAYWAGQPRARAPWPGRACVHAPCVCCASPKELSCARTRSSSTRGRREAAARVHAPTPHARTHLARVRAPTQHACMHAHAGRHEGAARDGCVRPCDCAKRREARLPHHRGPGPPQPHVLPGGWPAQLAGRRREAWEGIDTEEHCSELAEARAWCLAPRVDHPPAAYARHGR